MTLPQTVSPRARAVLALVDNHVKERLSAAIEKAAGSKPLKKKAEERYRLSEILKNGATAADGIAVATHIAKGIHPDLKLKDVTNLRLTYASGGGPGGLVGSHLLAGTASCADTTGNGARVAAAHDLYLLLNCEFEGESLWQWLVDKDADVLLAFFPEVASSEERELLGAGLSGLMQDKAAHPATDSRAKQLYWLVDQYEGASSNSSYHLLAPLYPASLVHELFRLIQEGRFGEEAKAARKARSEGRYHASVIRDYPNLAIQKLGGTQPHNVSYLNSMRSGVNYLLSSAPPSWQERGLRVPQKNDSIFKRIYGGLPDVRQTVRDLRNFLVSDMPDNMHTRDKRDGYSDILVGELVQLAAKYQNGLAPGWSRDANVELNEEEQLWLDPYRAAISEEVDFRVKWLRGEWREQVGRRFANWLNAQLERDLPVGEVEARHWKRELLLDEGEAGWAQELDMICRGIQAALVEAEPTEVEVQS